VRCLLRSGQYRAMADTWSTITVSEIRPGDFVRLQSGHEFEVARIDSPFLGMDTMVCLIEDSPSRWHAYPQGRDGEAEVRRPG
jgi:hypothetical protein